MTAAFLGWNVFQAHMQTLQRRRKGVNLQVAGFDTIFQRWTGFFLPFLFAQLRFTSLQYGRARATHRHHLHQSQLRQMA